MAKRIVKDPAKPGNIPREDIERAVREVTRARREPSGGVKSGSQSRLKK